MAHALFSTGVTNVERDLNCIQNRPCAICGQPGHSFSECNNLGDIKAVKDVFGRMVMAFKRVADICRKFGVTNFEKFQGKPLNALEMSKELVAEQINLINLHSTYPSTH